MARLNFKTVWNEARFQTSIIIGYVRRLRPHLIESWAGDDPNVGSNRWLIYSQFNRQGQICEYVLYALKALCDEGFRIIFVSNSIKFKPEQLTAIKPWCAKILKRRNVGYDFGAYREGILAIEDSSSIEALILMNDSVYGPLFPLRDTLDRMSSEEFDICGLTDSWEHAYHLQSYFYYFNRRILQSRNFREFWRTIPLLNNKKAVIRRLEVGLTQFFLQRGFRVGAAFPYYTLVDRFLTLIAEEERNNSSRDKTERNIMERLKTHLAMGSAVNPTHFFWEVLINEFKYPFIKTELLSLNPVSIYGINRWYGIISRQTQYNVDMIFEHLKLVG